MSRSTNVKSEVSNNNNIGLDFKTLEGGDVNKKDNSYDCNHPDANNNKRNGAFAKFCK